jgi:putative selenium metabolism hydrolase
LDRRLTKGETIEKAVSEIEALPSVRSASAKVTVLEYSRPSYTGLVYPMKKYYPTWVLDANHPAVLAGAAAAELVLGVRPRIDKWSFSTNGIATCGMFGIPTIGFGPADEKWAHTPEDQCPIEHLTLAAAFYAAFPQFYLETVPSRPAAALSGQRTS